MICRNLMAAINSCCMIVWILVANQADGALRALGSAASAPLTRTGAPTDLAIEGRGFFVVRDVANGERFFTRIGNFHLDAEGFLVLNTGFRLQGFNAPIRFGQTYGENDRIGDLKVDTGTFPPGWPASAANAQLINLFIDSDGRIILLLADGSAYIRGQIFLHNIENPQAVVRRWTYFLGDTNSTTPLKPLVQPNGQRLGNIVSGALDARFPSASVHAGTVLLDQTGGETEVWIIPASAVTVVQVSTDLIHWKSIPKSWESVRRLEPSGLNSIRFFDTAAKDQAVRFYRAAGSVIKQTGNATDLAISGSGYFVVRDPKSGAHFVTRAGNFTVDAQDFLITSEGLRLQGFNATIAMEQEYPETTPTGDLRFDKGIPPPLSVTAKTSNISVISIDSRGRIDLLLTDGSQYTRGQVLLQKFSNPFALVKVGNYLRGGLDAAGPLLRPGKPLTQELGRIDAGALLIPPEIEDN